MTCTYDNPSPEAEAKAKAARADAYNNATDADDALAAAESTWRDYLPLCWCNKCTGAWHEIDEEELHNGHK